MTAISITEVTAGSLEGTGAFDKIMSAMQIRLEEEFSQGRITGDDYANVYLGAMTASMQQAVAFALGRQNSDSQAELTKAQTLEVNAQTALVGQQRTNLVAENTNIGKQGLILDKQALDIVQTSLNKGKVLLQIEAQTALVEQQKVNLVSENTNSGKQGLLIDAQSAQATTQTALITQQKANLLAEAANIPKQGLQLDAQTALVTQQKANLIAEAINIEKQGDQLIAQTALVGQQKVNLAAEVANIPRQGALLDKQSLDLVQSTLNKVKEALVLDKQAAKLVTEESLLDRKILTEEAQYRDAVGDIAVTGVIGKQKLLYAAQTDGFARDAEQKLAKIIVDTWNVRRTTDSTTNPALTGLTDVDIKQVLTQARAAAGLT